jgi:hypothetical protein
MTTASQSWAGLTALVQAAWSSYAAGHPITDALGQSIKLTGSQYYIKCAAALLNVGAALPSAPPVSSTVQPVVLTYFQCDTTPSFLLLFTPGTTGDYIAVAVSKATSLGVNFQKTFTQTGHTDSATLFLDQTPAAQTVMGTFTVGTKAWVRCTPVNASGLTGSPLISQTAVIAPLVTTIVTMTSTVATNATATWSGSPTPANLIYQISPNGVNTWSGTTLLTNITSPDTITGLTTGKYIRARLQDPVTLAMGPWSASHVIM